MPQNGDGQMQRRCFTNVKKVLKTKKKLFISVFFKNESIKTKERKVQQSKQKFTIQRINFNNVYGKVMLEEMLGGKKKNH